MGNLWLDTDKGLHGAGSYEGVRVPDRDGEPDAGRGAYPFSFQHADLVSAVAGEQEGVRLHSGDVPGSERKEAGGLGVDRRRAFRDRHVGVRRHRGRMSDVHVHGESGGTGGEDLGEEHPGVRHGFYPKQFRKVLNAFAHKQEQRSCSAIFKGQQIAGIRGTGIWYS